MTDNEFITIIYLCNNLFMIKSVIYITMYIYIFKLFLLFMEEKTCILIRYFSYGGGGGGRAKLACPQQNMYIIFCWIKKSSSLWICQFYKNGYCTFKHVKIAYSSIMFAILPEGTGLKAARLFYFWRSPYLQLGKIIDD